VKRCVVAMLLAVVFAGCTAVGSPVPKPRATNAWWTAGVENGTLSEWSGGGGQFNSGSAETVASRTVAHSGRWSAQLRARTNVESGTRLFRWAEPRAHAEGYYSAWFYFPSAERPTTYWNIFQFKSKTATRNDPFWIVNVGNRPSGAMYLYLYDWKQRRSYEQRVADVPVGRWVHLQAYLRQSASGDGRVKYWQDGKLLWDLPNVTTRYPDGDNQWSVNNYADGFADGSAAIYVDDAMAAPTR
jgi:hypothetical protein